MKGQETGLDGLRKVIILARLITHLANEYGGKVIGSRGKDLANNIKPRLYDFF